MYRISLSFCLVILFGNSLQNYSLYIIDGDALMSQNCLDSAFQHESKIQGESKCMELYSCAEFVDKFLLVQKKQSYERIYHNDFKLFKKAAESHQEKIGENHIFSSAFSAYNEVIKLVNLFKESSHVDLFDLTELAKNCDLQDAENFTEFFRYKLKELIEKKAPISQNKIVAHNEKPHKLEEKKYGGYTAKQLENIQSNKPLFKFLRAKARIDKNKGVGSHLKNEILEPIKD